MSVINLNKPFVRHVAILSPREEAESFSILVLQLISDHVQSKDYITKQGPVVSTETPPYFQCPGKF